MPNVVIDFCYRYICLFPLIVHLIFHYTIVEGQGRDLRSSKIITERMKSIQTDLDSDPNVFIIDSNNSQTKCIESSKNLSIAKIVLESKLDINMCQKEIHIQGSTFF